MTLTVADPRKRFPTKTHAPEALASQLPDDAATPERETLDREVRVALRAAVARLPERYRVVVVLRYFNELSVDEVAAATGRSSSTVGVQLLRARRLLRKAMGESGV